MYYIITSKSPKNQQMSYSQNNEESIILEYFKGMKPGKFVDIGAFDPFKFSNVRALYEKGWSGILVEPSPDNFKRIEDHYKGEERIRVLNLAVGPETKMIDFYESIGDAVSTSNENHKEKWGSAGVQYNKIQVPQVSVSYFMDKFCVVTFCCDTDFLNIDTEATNFELFSLIPDVIWQGLKMLCIEHDLHDNEIEAKLTPFGFTRRYTNAENIILAK